MNEEEMKRKEKLAGLLFNLANTSFGGAVIGVLVTCAVGVKAESVITLFSLLIFGIFSTIALSCVAYNILKEENYE